MGRHSMDLYRPLQGGGHAVRIYMKCAGRTIIFTTTPNAMVFERDSVSDDGLMSCIRRTTVVRVQTRKWGRHGMMKMEVLPLTRVWIQIQIRTGAVTMARSTRIELRAHPRVVLLPHSPLQQFFLTRLFYSTSPTSMGKYSVHRLHVIIFVPLASRHIAYTLFFGFFNSIHSKMIQLLRLQSVHL